MPKRTHVYLEGPIADEIRREAIANRRSISKEANQIIFLYFAQRRQEKLAPRKRQL